MDLSPLWVSLGAAILSTVITLFSGIAAAYYVVKLRNVWKGLADCILTFPMILPPTVIGYFLLQLLGVNGPIGRILLHIFDFKIIFSWQAAVISSAVVSFPLMYRSVRGAFEHFDRSIQHSAQTLGLSNGYIFWRIILPNCRYGVLSGAILAFARGIGEFGATIMIAGNIPGKTQTIAVAVYSALAAGNERLAFQWVMINLALSSTVLLLMNINGRHLFGRSSDAK